MHAIMRWTVIMPMSALAVAKSRLVGATSDARSHRELVVAMRIDAIAACLDAANVARLLIVTDEPTAHQLARPDRIDVVPDPPEPGLNAAVRAGEQYAQHWPADGVAALVSDLPCLHARSVADALLIADDWPRSAVVDHNGTGTTMLTGRPGVDLDPRFGPGSAHAHLQTGAVPITADDRIRCDVDTPADLALALLLGVGPATDAALRRIHRPGDGDGAGAAQ